jgi:thiol-disulfide isomerase/thioredoxin
MSGCDEAVVSPSPSDPLGQPAPELDQGLAWLNTDAPVRLADLGGHVILIDFWTYGCVNCLHIMPDLRALEEHFAGQPFVVLGVHSGKFDAEQDAGHISEAIRRYDVRHPVLVDDDYATMVAYAARAWPTTVLIDASGLIRLRLSGEFDYEVMRANVSTLLDEAAEDGTLSAVVKDLNSDPNAGSKTPLLYPTSVTTGPDGSVTLSDAGHHRVVLLRPDEAEATVIGTGFRGWVDGPLQGASFSSPQGTAWLDDALYIADTENHVIRRVDWATEDVTTVAGTGVKGVGRHTLGDGWMEAATTSLRSPWALEPLGDELIVAMAGSHQLYRFAPSTGQVSVFSGSGLERLTDGSAAVAGYSQPSGLTLSQGGATLYVADTEASAIRAVSPESGEAQTLVGEGLFEFGDVDGVGGAVRLQHPLDVAMLPDGRVALSDTYNDVLKRLDPATLAVETWVMEVPGGALAEPRGISVYGDQLYIVDTNNHRLLVHDLDAEVTEVVSLRGLRAPLLSGVAEAR